MNPLKELENYGQSFWLDYLGRGLITSGELERLVAEDGLRGVTSNPTIFQKSIGGGTDHDKALNDLLETNPHADAYLLYERVTVEDVQMAADILRPVFAAADGADGFVSLEVSPLLADNTEGTCTEARRLWQEVDRPNLMIKIPATQEGIPAIETLTAEGININITLIFSLKHYEAAANAYIRGVKRCANPKRIASVASFFLSRIDTRLDQVLEAIGTPVALALRGKTALAVAKMAYQRFLEIFHAEPFAEARSRGVRVQRPLWASTSTKNPAYSDVLYIEALIEPDTVNTMPLATVNAFRDHGQMQPSLTEELDEAEATLKHLAELGVGFKTITEKLQADGVKSFADSYNRLIAVLKEKCR